MELETRAGAVCLLYSTGRKLTSRALSRQHIWSWNGNFHASNACFRRRSKREIMERDCSTSISIFRSPYIFIWRGGNVEGKECHKSVYELKSGQKSFHPLPLTCHLVCSKDGICQPPHPDFTLACRTWQCWDAVCIRDVSLRLHCHQDLL